LQPEGKKPMSAEEFKRGHHDFNPAEQGTKKSP
ncbi:unnamed protein product, partial [marine sediment metagenome]